MIDQSPVGATARSNPATYTGVMDDVRKAFAGANKVDAGLFSFNSKGACEDCKGTGVIYTDLAFLDGVKTPCEVCQGRRFKDEVLAYTLDGKSISDVLALTVAQALDFFTQREIVRKLQAMSDVGLDYLTLGQPLSTLSGGECQRIKLASELHKEGSIYVLDEPTTGLHLLGHRQPAGDHQPPGGRREHGDRDRAQPGRDPQRGLDHRPGPGGGQQGRAPGLRRDAAGAAGGAGVADGAVLAGGGVRAPYPGAAAGARRGAPQSLVATRMWKREKAVSSATRSPAPRQSWCSSERVLTTLPQVSSYHWARAAKRVGMVRRASSVSG